MSSAKIDIAIGEVKFSGEGTENWVAEQLEKVLSTAQALQSRAPTAPPNERTVGGHNSEAIGTTSSLASFIRTHNGESNQVKRFLGTAEWLRRRGVAALTTTAVAKALKDNHQSRLGNPADCLNKLCAQGLCEKTENGFFITPEGLNVFET